MATHTDVFERKEVKYRLSAGQLRALVSALEGRMAPDAFGRTRVTSLYFDTPARSLIDRSLEKPLYKEKLRLRAYGAPAPDGLVFIELKKKFKGIVYKRRVGCSYRAARAYLAGVSYEQACARFPLADAEAAAESRSPRSLQIAAEIDQFMLRHEPLVPSMYIACERVAYAPVFDAVGEHVGGSHADMLRGGLRDDVPSDLRITFDEAIAYRDLFADSSATGVAVSVYVPLLGAGEAVMEVKASGPFPLWLVRALDECRAYPTSFSKYGTAYRACAGAYATAATTAEFEHAKEPLSTLQPERANPSQHAIEYANQPAPVNTFEPVSMGVSQPAPAARAHPTTPAAEAKAEHLAAALRDTRPRRFSAPIHHVKKGGRCA